MLPPDGVGATQPLARRKGLYLRLIGDQFVDRFPLPTVGEVVIGRAPDVDIRIDDESISRRHAVLRMGLLITIEDLGSANGTRVGGQLLTPGQLVEVNPLDVIDLGSVLLVMQAGPDTPPVRRLLPYGYFCMRLEQECVRAARAGGTFAVIQIRLESAESAPIVEEVLAERLRESDVLSSYAPGLYELLLLEIRSDAARRIALHLESELNQKGARARASIAVYPEDGRNAETLLAQAQDRRRPSDRPVAPTTLVVEDDSMARLHRLVGRIAPSRITVLIMGETGVGKEVTAELVHRKSDRASAPFLRLNCAALSESLLESELFGHEKGAFTSANQAKPGLFETAKGGTVFLDEVGELTPALQVKLLRVLEERKMMRVGGLKPIDIDVRFIAATNRNLEDEVAAGRFRQDLFFRLNGMMLIIPPLRERMAELDGLVRSFIRDAVVENGRNSEPRLSRAARDLLAGYTWPGNIRELRNLIERAVLLCDGDSIEVEHFPLEKMRGAFIERTAHARTQAPQMTTQPPPTTEEPGREVALMGELEAIERQRIADALAKCNGNQTRAAKLLGISRSTLVMRLEAHGFPRPRKR